MTATKCRREGKHLIGVTALQVDDTFGFGTDQFLEKEEVESKKFKTNPRKILKRGDEKDFNGSLIEISRVREFGYTP